MDMDNTENSNSSTKSGVSGFDRGFEAEQILSVISGFDGKLMFLIKFKGLDDPEIVPAKVANIKIPQMVIRFYEERLFWD